MEWGVMRGIRKGGNGSVGGTGTDGNIKRKREKSVKRRRREKEKKKRTRTSYWIRHYRCRYTLNSRYAHRGGYEKIQ